jgi:hypothetical protein
VVLRGERGQTAAEYLGVLLIVLAIISAVATTSIGGEIGARMQALVCKIAGTECEGEAGASDTQQALDERARALDEWADEHGDRFRDLLDEADAANESGDYEEADRILDLLELYRQLADGPRGDDIDALIGASDSDFEDLLAEGTTYQEDGKYNRRYFQLDPAPGEGVLV